MGIIFTVLGGIITGLALNMLNADPIPAAMILVGGTLWHIGGALNWRN